MFARANFMGGVGSPHSPPKKTLGWTEKLGKVLGGGKFLNIQTPHLGRGKFSISPTFGTKLPKCPTFYVFSATNGGGSPHKIWGSSRDLFGKQSNRLWMKSERLDSLRFESSIIYKRCIRNNKKINYYCNIVI